MRYLFVIVTILLAMFTPQLLHAQERLTAIVTESEINTSPLLVRARSRIPSFAVDLQADQAVTETTLNISGRQFSIVSIWTLSIDAQGQLSWTAESSAINTLQIDSSRLDTLNLIVRRLLEDIIADCVYRQVKIEYRAHRLERVRLTENDLALSIVRDR
ncbi:MAG: hypothetical protein RML95_13340 [Anaerolineae bacterium]|nr:hypothetical protein [Anaerolineae bacterium]MDW8300311.1 hypothetical protein [Anaerolineae bacterium]